MLHSGSPWGLALLVLASAGFGSAVKAADFPPVTAEQRALSEVPGSPETGAVMLRSSGEFWLMDLLNGRPSSTLRVTERLKILTPQGAATYGEIEIPHSRNVRLSSFEGRTVLPDGREVTVPKDGMFRQVSSRSERLFVTSVAFPGVEPGAILDWTYEISVDTLMAVEPWYFQSAIPVLRSEITYHIPGYLAVVTWGTSLPNKPFQEDRQSEPGGTRLRVWLDDLPPTPDEPFSFPEEDLRAKFMLIPKEMVLTPGESIPLMHRWKDVCELLEEPYRTAGKSSKAVKLLAKELEEEVKKATPEGDRRERAESAYRFVRDEIRTLVSGSVFPRAKTDLGDVLKSGEGTTAEKALLLQTLLEELTIESDLVWVPNRWAGNIDINVPSPWWFEKTIVRVLLPRGGKQETVFLDPSDPRLGFGHLNPTNEDVPAIVYDIENPETISIPLTPAIQSRRQATIELDLDTHGRLRGAGELELTGHHAWVRMSLGIDADALAESWREWLSERWNGYVIDGVEVEETRESRHVRVRWTMAQREEEVLGDEVSLQPSRPLGPVLQIFQLDPSRRTTPVLLPFPEVDEVETRVSWPEGWELELAPDKTGIENSAGESKAIVTVDPDARSLTYARNMTVLHRQFRQSAHYSALRAIYETMEKSDAQALVLVAR